MLQSALKEIVDNGQGDCRQNEFIISAMLSSMLTEKISAVDGYERAQKIALAQLDQEFHFVGKYSQTREALHERKDLR